MQIMQEQLSAFHAGHAKSACPGLRRGTHACADDGLDDEVANVFEAGDSRVR